MKHVQRFKAVLDSMSYKRDPKLVRREAWAKAVLFGGILVAVLYGLSR